MDDVRHPLGSPDKDGAVGGATANKAADTGRIGSAPSENAFSDVKRADGQPKSLSPAAKLDRFEGEDLRLHILWTFKDEYLFENVVDGLWKLVKNIEPLLAQGKESELLSELKASLERIMLTRQYEAPKMRTFHDIWWSLHTEIVSQVYAAEEERESHRRQWDATVEAWVPRRSSIVRALLQE
jgi:hypothetical protein